MEVANKGEVWGVLTQRIYAGFWLDSSKSVTVMKSSKIRNKKWKEKREEF